MRKCGLWLLILLSTPAQSMPQREGEGLWSLFANAACSFKVGGIHLFANQELFRVPEKMPSEAAVIKFLELIRNSPDLDRAHLIHWEKWIIAFGSSVNVQAAFLKTIISSRFLASQGAAILSRHPTFFPDAPDLLLAAALVPGAGCCGLNEENTNAAMVLAQSGPGGYEKILDAVVDPLLAAVKNGQGGSIREGQIYILNELLLFQVRGSYFNGLGLGKTPQYYFVRLDYNYPDKPLNEVQLGILADLNAQLASAVPKWEGLISINNVYLAQLQSDPQSSRKGGVRVLDWVKRSEPAPRLLGPIQALMNNSAEWVRIHAVIALFLSTQPQSTLKMIADFIVLDSSDLVKLLAFSCFVETAKMVRYDEKIENNRRASKGEEVDLKSKGLLEIPFLNLGPKFFRSLPDLMIKLKPQRLRFQGGSRVLEYERLDDLNKIVDSIAPTLRLPQDSAP